MVNAEIFRPKQTPEVPQNSGLLLIFTGPTASGKTDSREAVHGHFPHMQQVISATTRKPRNGNESNYQFVSDEEFTVMIKSGEFLEWVRYGDNRYGTLKKSFEPLFSGTDLSMTMDMSGAYNFKEKIQNAFSDEKAQYILERTIILFIGVPNLLTLRDRFMGREGKRSDFFKRLRQDWKDWQQYGPSFEHIIENANGEEEFNKTVSTILKLIENKRSQLSQKAI